MAKQKRNNKKATQEGKEIKNKTFEKTKGVCVCVWKRG